MPSDLETYMEENLLSKGRLYLIVDDSKESALAIFYMQDRGFNLEVITKERLAHLKETMKIGEPTRYFSNTFRENQFPSLIVSHDNYTSPFIFISFSGVKSFLRDDIRNKELNKGKRLAPKKFYWRNVETFYPPDKKVTCFRENGKKIFEGPIDKSPFNLKPPLEKYDFKDWYEVSGRVIGSLDEIRKKQISQGINKGIVVDKKTKTVLFPDEIDILRNTGIVITSDIRSIYEVEYEAYFSKNGRIFGIYAYMLD